MLLIVHQLEMNKNRKIGMQIQKRKYAPPPALKGNLCLPQFFLFSPCLLIELHNRFCCLCQVCTAIRHQRADKREKALKSPLMTYGRPLLCHTLRSVGGDRRDARSTFWTRQTFHFSKSEGLHPVRSGENSTHRSSSSLICLLLNRLKTTLLPQQNHPQMAPTERNRYMI